LFVAGGKWAALRVGGVEVFNFKGLGQYNEWAGRVYLRAGLHRIAVDFAVLDKAYRGTDSALTIQYSGPGIEKQVVPESVLFHK